MPVNVKAKLVSKEEISKDIFKFEVSSQQICDLAKPGQFLEIKCGKGLDPFLRRPISIYNVNKEKGTVEFIFQVKGQGTRILSEEKVGEDIDLIGPLGYGSFNYEGCKNVAIIGGGIGTFPLYELAKNVCKNANITVYLGFRNKEFVVLEEEFKKVCNKLVITTDDGSYAQKGFAIDVLKEDNKKENFDMIFACGPLPMLRAIRNYAIEEDVPCQISLEERMGCGVGACLGCAVKVVSRDEPRYGHVCKEGPVFNAKDVEI